MTFMTKTAVWTVATIGAVISLLLWIVRILREGESGGVVPEYDILNFTIFKYEDFKRIVSDWQSIKAGKKKVILIYGVHDKIKDNAVKTLREMVLDFVPETRHMEDFLILAVVDGAELNAKDLKFHIIKFEKLEDCLYERFVKSRLFTDGAMVIGKFN